MHTLSSSTLFVQVRQLTLDLLLIPRVTKGKEDGRREERGGEREREGRRDGGWQTPFPITDEVHCVFDTPFQFSLNHLSYAFEHCIFLYCLWFWFIFYSSMLIWSLFLQYFTSALHAAFSHRNHRMLNYCLALLIHFNRRNCRRLWICYQCYKLSPLSLSLILSLSLLFYSMCPSIRASSSSLISWNQICFTRALSVLELFEIIGLFGLLWK